jgi:hypothetical protein
MTKPTQEQIEAAINALKPHIHNNPDYGLGTMRYLVGGGKSWNKLLDKDQLETILAALEAYDETPDWQPSCCDAPKGIHSNPDARAWAKFFVDIYPQHAHMEDVMLGWFANAMMAMHDSIESKPVDVDQDMADRINNAVFQMIEDRALTVDRERMEYMYHFGKYLIEKGII